MKPVVIFALGMSITAVNLLEMALKKSGKGRYLLGNADQADVVILDFDHVNSAQLVEAQRNQFPDRPILALSIRPQNDPRLHHLQKPMRVDTLLKALETALIPSKSSVPSPAANKREEAPIKPISPILHAPIDKTREVLGPNLGGRLRNDGNDTTTMRTLSDTQQLRTRSATKMMETEAIHSLCGVGPDVPLEDSRRAPAAFYDPQNFVQGRILQALHAAQPHHVPIQIQAIKPIVIFPEKQLAFTELDERRLRAVCLMPLATTIKSWQLLPADYEPNAAQSPIELETFLWQVALWTAHGRLPTGTDPHRPIGLRGWPNMTRLLLPPHSLRIAALWTRQFISPVETARCLGIPQRNAFSFYSACNAINLLEYAPEKSQSARDATLQASSQRGFFQRLLGVLGRTA